VAHIVVPKGEVGAEVAHFEGGDVRLEDQLGDVRACCR
jgi:hypothetical protein